ncbi:MAG: NAD(P)H-hydrate epimerase [archaeon]|nr:NAD(P)H-hydrate epimerase [archaeon]
MLVKTLTSSEMAELDRTTIDDYGIELRMMMENAGRGLARRAREFLGSSLVGKRILVLVGKGNNGGGGIVSARHMHNWGADITIVLATRELAQEPAKQLSILQKMQVRIQEQSPAISESKYDLILDSLLGYNQKGNPRPEVARLVEFANNSGLPTIALDIPTGLDPNTGRPSFSCIKAAQTLTLALPKACFLSEEGRKFSGGLYLADISIPRNEYFKLGVQSEKIFESDTVVKLNYARDENDNNVLTKT